MATIKNDDIYGSTGQTNGIIGTSAKDTIGGTAAGDVINGKGGADIITGFAGNDIFSFATAYASKTIDGAAQIMDFKDGVDLIGLQGDLTFANLKVAQGVGAHIADTIVSLTSGEVLVTLVGVNATAINASDFIHMA
jgi:Ca2+-binding RTX toxin-like protein